MDQKKRKVFDKAFKEFSAGIFRFIYFRVSDYELAQDLTEDTFVRFWKLVNRDTQVQNEKALLYVIARGLIIDHYRKKKTQKNVNIDSIDERLLGTFDNTEDKLSVKQDLEQILLKIKRLRAQYQEVLVLHYIEDLEIAEIANILQKKENAVRVMLHRALKSLKELV